jgi:hypothetical protein
MCLYLPSVIPAAAGLPLPMSPRAPALITLAKVAITDAPEIAGFHRRLIDSGIIDAW